MFFEPVDLYRTLHLKSNPMDSSHFQNNTKRMKNCPVTASNMNEPSKRGLTGVIIALWCRLRYLTMETLSQEILIYCYVTNITV